MELSDTTCVELCSALTTRDPDAPTADEREQQDPAPTMNAVPSRVERQKRDYQSLLALLARRITQRQLAQMMLLSTQFHTQSEWEALAQDTTFDKLVASLQDKELLSEQKTNVLKNMLIQIDSVKPDVLTKIREYEARYGNLVQTSQPITKPVLYHGRSWY
ncbi:PREDICTED: uncharacterized protein LOC109485344 isoform X4 [Branchiostoma belcheri]|uniref:Uncharacterized protein LOC109485344 isoform X3 n=1 Tax=Branchiostoma belcheri TaxID=7741 RepID=A0A6P5AN25_BRABE|nr:PREDICTED: uncharacterized protein LOC109485344 isoform X3 [Branchiostoma belcheri]XP_019644462.1 PREDICTED: uncharacterized protein LOC109485344 isoform X4 [Branchiostoma belcheri]